MRKLITCVLPLIFATDDIYFEGHLWSKISANRDLVHIS